MTTKPNLKSEAEMIESARRAYHHRTGGRGIKVEFVISDNLVHPVRNEDVIALYCPQHDRIVL